MSNGLPVVTCNIITFSAVNTVEIFIPRAQKKRSFGHHIALHFQNGSTTMTSTPAGETLEAISGS
jgi:hypothetical protein